MNTSNQDKHQVGQRAMPGPRISRRDPYRLAEVRELLARLDELRIFHHQAFAAAISSDSIQSVIDTLNDEIIRIERE